MFYFPANFLSWNYFLNKADETTYELRNLTQTFEYDYYGNTPSTQARSDFCFNLVNNDIPMPLTRLYVDQYFDQSIKVEVSSL